MKTLLFASYLYLEVWKRLVKEAVDYNVVPKMI